MAAMLAHFVLLVAAAAAAPSDGSRATGARAEGRVSVTILSGARVAAGEAQDEALPALRDSSIRNPEGEPVPARLVEFQ